MYMKFALLALSLFWATPTHAVTAYLNRYATANDGLDDTVGLLNAIAAADRVIITPGQWDFVGPLINGEHYAFQRCRITGPANEAGANHQEEGRIADRWVSQLRVTGLAAGQYWINWEPDEAALPEGVDRGGPMEFSNTSIKIVGATGCALNYGDAPTSTDLYADSRVLKLKGLYVTAPDQVTGGAWDGVTLPAWSHNSLVQIHRGFDTVIEDCGFGGCGTGIRLHGCDRALLRRVHFMHQLVPVRVDNLPTHTTVPCILDDVFIEAFCGTGIYCETGELDKIHTECGYGQDIGAIVITVVSDDWDIAAGDDYVDFTGTGINCLNKFFHGQVVSLNADTYLIVDDVDATGFTFINPTTHSYFGAAQSGTTITGYYGVGIVGVGDRFSLDSWSTDINQVETNLPMAAFAPNNCTMTIGPWFNGISANYDITNRSVIVGHCAGSAFSIEGSVNFLSKLMAPLDTHPLYHAGTGPLPASATNGWLTPLITSSNDDSKYLRFYRVGTRWTVRPDDTPSGWNLPDAVSHTLQVYSASGDADLTCYYGHSTAVNHPLNPGWNNIVLHEDDPPDPGTTTVFNIYGTGTDQATVAVEITKD